MIKSMGAFIGSCTVQKQGFIGFQPAKFNDLMSKISYMIKNLMSSRLKDFLLNLPSARPIIFLR